MFQFLTCDELQTKSLEWSHDSLVCLYVKGHVYAVCSKRNGRKRYKTIDGEFKCKVFHCHRYLTIILFPEELENPKRLGRRNYYKIRIERYQSHVPNIQLEYIRPKYQHSFLDDDTDEEPSNSNDICERHECLWIGKIEKDVNLLIIDNVV